MKYPEDNRHSEQLWRGEREKLQNETALRMVVSRIQMVTFSAQLYRYCPFL